MPKNLLIAFLLFTGFTTIAQPKAMGKNDADAKAVLDGVSNKFRSYKTMTAKFNLKIENAAGKQQGSKSGTVSLKGSKYKIDVTGQEIFSDGTNIWTLDKAANEVQVTKFDNSANAITPQKLFTNFYDKDFLYKLNNDAKEGGKTIQEIELTPIDKSKPFFKVLVSVDKASRNIIRTKVFEKNGNRYTYSVNNFVVNTNLPDAMFIFNKAKYPKAEVVDLR